MFLEKSIWRVHLSNLWCTFAQAIFVFWVYRSRWVDCFGCSMVRFVDSMPSVMRYPPSYDVLLYHNKVSVREKIYHIFQNCRNLPLKISSMNQVMFHVVVLFPSLRIWKWFLTTYRPVLGHQELRKNNEWLVCQNHWQK